MTLEEVECLKDPDKTVVRYMVSSSGLPKDKAFNLWIWTLAMEQPQSAGDYVVDESGGLIHIDNQESFEGFRIGDFTRGEVVRATLISTDGAMQVFASDTPFPAESKGPGGCRLWVELLRRDGTAFRISGAGFDPNEEVSARSQSVHESFMTSNKAESDGTFTVIMFPAVIGYLGGSAKYTAIGKTCDLAVEYE